MYKKYCGICLGEGLEDFDSVLDLVHEPGTKVGRMHSPTVLIATFISTFSQYEIYELFKSTVPKNFLLMEVGDYTIHMDKEDVQDVLLEVFEGLDTAFTFTSTEVIKSMEEIELEDEVAAEYELLVYSMSPREKQDKIDAILDIMPNITKKDKFILALLTK